MNFPTKASKLPNPSDFGLDVESSGILCAGGCRTTDLAAQFGTPLHVVHEDRLSYTTSTFRNAFVNSYPGKVSIHYAFKCNPIPGVIALIKSGGLRAEVMSSFELALALKLGYTGSDIIVNGPFKPDAFIDSCIREAVRFIIIDSIDELKNVNRLAGYLNKKVAILLRLNPDYTPKGMNKGTATGNRKGCAFGLDLKGGEVEEAFQVISKMEYIQFCGFHFHIGSGIRNPKAYFETIILLKKVIQTAISLGHSVAVLDIGGGIASPTTREMTSLEMLWYQATNRLPASSTRDETFTFKDFADVVTEAISKIFDSGFWPELIIEPGRSIASPNQMLLLGVHAVKERRGIRKWLVTDGGIGTVSMPTFYEFHDVFLCNDIKRTACEYVTINGPGCFAADIVYSNKYMPKVYPGEILAIMDSGAYFNSWESNFGYPRPAVIGVKNGTVHVLRQRETIEQMMWRDKFDHYESTLNRTS